MRAIEREGGKDKPINTNRHSPWYSYGIWHCTLCIMHFHSGYNGNE
jgi:hypothetical protein